MRRLLLLLLLLPALASAQRRDTLRVLSIGNSFARDCFSYAPMLIEELSPETYVEWGILYIGGCTLQQQWANASSAKEVNTYQFDYYTTSQGRWTTTKAYSLQRGLRRARWALVTFQQQSFASMTYRTYQPYLNNLMTYVRRQLPDVVFAWHLTPAYPEASPRLPRRTTSQEMWRRTQLAAQQVMLHAELAFVIPTGTAIQNARSTALKRLGRFGSLSYEGLHTAEGIPCLTAAYVAADRILTFYGRAPQITRSQLRVTQAWVKAKNIPEQHGTVPPTPPTDYTLAQACALAAINNPYRLTKITAK